MKVSADTDVHSLLSV